MRNKQFHIGKVIVIAGFVLLMVYMGRKATKFAKTVQHKNEIAATIQD